MTMKLINIVKKPGMKNHQWTIKTVPVFLTFGHVMDKFMEETRKTGFNKIVHDLRDGNDRLLVRSDDIVIMVDNKIVF